MSDRKSAAEQALARDLATLREEHHILVVEKRFVPAGFKLIEGYQHEDGRVIIVGEPTSHEVHNCDEMGCTTLSHVIARTSQTRLESLHRLDRCIEAIIAADADFREQAPEGFEGDALTEAIDEAKKIYLPSK